MGAGRIGAQYAGNAAGLIIVMKVVVHNACTQESPLPLQKAVGIYCQILILDIVFRHDLGGSKRLSGIIRLLPAAAPSQQEIDCQNKQNDFLHLTSLFPVPVLFMGDWIHKMTLFLTAPKDGGFQRIGDVQLDGIIHHIPVHKVRQIQDKLFFVRPNEA